MAQTEFPDLALPSWFGVLAPKQTSVPIVEKLYQAFNAALSKPDARARLASMSPIVAASLPASF